MTATTIRFEPIANQIGRQLTAPELFPSDVLTRVRPPSEPDEPALPKDIEDFALHYFAVAGAAGQLLHHPAFERLVQLMEDIEEEYMPGGPPMSPVYDSMSMQHVLSEVPVGAADETPYSVVAKLTTGSPRYARFHQLARALADAHLDMYQVKQSSGLEAVLSPIRGGAELVVRATGPFFERKDLVLARVVPFENAFFVADSPYLLTASSEEWLAYLARVGESLQGSPSPVAQGKPKGKLSPKQEAKWRQRQRQNTQRLDPEAGIRRHLKRGPSERYWLDYIMDAYSGERRGIVFLAGVPDRPESLPHSSEYVPSQELPPMARIHQLLQKVAADQGMLVQAVADLSEAFAEFGLERSELDPNELQLFIAYSTLAARSPDGARALDKIKDECQEPAAARGTYESLLRGGFAAFRIDRIHLDQGFDVSELRSGKKLIISERAGTRQLSLGDLLLGWLCTEAEERLTLEGHVMHVPAIFAAAGTELLRTLRGKARCKDFREDPGTLPLRLLVGLRVAREQFQMDLVNMSGDRLQFATGRYAVLDRKRVLARLSEAFDSVDDSTFRWLDDEDRVLACIEVAKNKLTLQVNSLERLQAVKARVETLLGDAIKPSLDSLEQSIDPALGKSRPPRESAALELPPEVAASLREHVMQQIRNNLDSPIPQFRGKTLRQVARNPKSRPDAISWLRDQERILQSNPQLAGFDMRPLWQELSLEYQGLDTDPA